MQEHEYKELLNVLRQPHRSANVFAVFRACETAAELLNRFKDEIIAPAEEKKPARKTRAKKSD